MVWHNHKAIHSYSAIVNEKAKTVNYYILHSIISQQVLPLQNGSGEKLWVFVESDFIHYLK